jgi:hypothetical protein
LNIELKDIGIVDGLQTYEVIDKDTGEVIGLNQTVPTDEA